MRMGSDASLSELLDTLEGVYGILEVGDSLVLYRAKTPDEFEEKDPNKKLYHFFWKGLHQYPKDANGHNYNQISNLV